MISALFIASKLEENVKSREEIFSEYFGNKTVWITGASSGIGEALVSRFPPPSSCSFFVRNPPPKVVFHPLPPSHLPSPPSLSSPLSLPHGLRCPQALSLYRAGAKVVISARRVEELERVKRTCLQLVGLL